MPQLEQRTFIENKNAKPSLEHGDVRSSINIQEEGEENRAEESAQAQRAAEKEAILVLERMKQLPSQSLEEKHASEVNMVMEYSDERLETAKQALDDLFRIAERRSPVKFILSEQAQILIHRAQDFFKEKKALNVLKQELPFLEEDMGSAERCGAVVQFLERMVHGMESNKQIKTYASANRKLEKKLITLATQMLAGNADRLATSLEGSTEIDVAMPQILLGVVENQYRTSHEQSERVVKLMTQLQPYIESQIDKMRQERHIYDVSLDQYAFVLRPLIFAGDEAPSQRARDCVVDIFIGSDDPRVLRKICESSVYADGIEKGLQTLRAQGVALAIVSRMGLDAEKFYDADKNEKLNVKENFINNILAAQALESSLPGSVKRLAEEYGIQSFARYPKKLLLRQLEKEDDKETPYGVILNPREDWNGGFYGDRGVFSDFSDSARDEKMNVRVFECESKLDVAKKLIRLHRKYGVGQKIQFAIVGGHGDKGLLEFGQEERKTLKKDDLGKKAIQELRSFFVENATIVLNSCSTGDDFGLGEMMSRLGQVTVVAPDQPASLLFMNVQRQGEKCIVSVGYEPTTEGKNVLRRYEKGNLVAGTRSKIAQRIEELI